MTNHVESLYLFNCVNSNSDSEPLSKCRKLEHPISTTDRIRVASRSLENNSCHSKEVCNNTETVKGSSDAEPLSKYLKSQNPTRTREQYFKTLQHKLISCSSLTSMLTICQEESLVKYPIGLLKDISLFSMKARIDSYAQKLLPEDIPSNISLFPTIIYGDGNCLPRCGSFFAFGTEDCHIEVRVRIAIELITHSSYYLDNCNLSKGHEKRNNYALQYAGCSPAYGGQKIKDDPKRIRKVFEEEIFQTVQNGIFLGMWQLMALSSVLQAKIYSVYPSMGYNVRDDYHRWIHPRGQRTENVPCIYIMWSKIGRDKDKINPAVWYPNHFVPLVQMFSQR